MCVIFTHPTLRLIVKNYASIWEISTAAGSEKKTNSVKIHSLSITLKIIAAANKHS